jgi:hypothetical protein
MNAVLLEVSELVLRVSRKVRQQLEAVQQQAGMMQRQLEVHLLESYPGEESSRCNQLCHLDQPNMGQQLLEACQFFQPRLPK